MAKTKTRTEAAAYTPTEEDVPLPFEAPQEQSAAGADIPATEPEVRATAEPEAAATAPLPTDAEMADPEAMPDADMLRRLIAAIGARNVPHLRDALWTELQNIGGHQEGYRFTLAGISSTGEGTAASFMTNWANAARRKLNEMEAANV